jgi:hypothetical protein
VIVGSGGDTLSVAWAWTEQTGFQILELALAGAPGIAGWRLTEALGVSADGRTIIGVGLPPGSTTAQAWVGTLPPPACYANCDGSTTAPALTVADFACFLNSFAAGCP